MGLLGNRSIMLFVCIDNIGINISHAVFQCAKGADIHRSVVTIIALATIDLSYLPICNFPVLRVAFIFRQNFILTSNYNTPLVKIVGFHNLFNPFTECVDFIEYTGPCRKLELINQKMICNCRQADIFPAYSRTIIREHRCSG